MYISSIKVKNFRLLRDYSIDLEQSLSLIVGKNNVGKTSLLKVLGRFLDSTKSQFQFNDFSIAFRDNIKDLLDGDEISEELYNAEGITMRITIKYEECDDLEFISPILMTLDVDNFYAVLGFDYTIGYTNYLQMRKDYNEFKAKETEKTSKNAEYIPKDWLSFIEKAFSKYFKTTKKTISVDKNANIDEKTFINLNDIQNFKIEDLISFKYIDARRLVDNAESDKTLSSQTSQLYEIMEGDGSKQEIINSLIDHLKDMDKSLSVLYENLFQEIRDKIKDFGGMSPNDTKISVVSTLSHKNLINGNTTIRYEQDGKNLPESYNGLGYMNLLSMIFQIEYIRQQFIRTSSRKPADLNLLFIEEPEAHTHPQMQYIFIQNIKKLLSEGIKNKNGIKRPLQYIISTHSSHIVADCDFEDIKYMLTIDGYSYAKNINELISAYENDEKGFAFLKQYLTVNRSELFFADKAIIIEGDTERILMPAMMKKFDEENPISEGDSERYLLSQNISIVEVGAYSHIFMPFFNFINLKKVCVITDLDVCLKDSIVDKNGNNRIVTKACPWSKECLDELITSNASIKHYLNGIESIKVLDSLTPEDKIRLFDSNVKYDKSTLKGNLRLCYQVEECDYHARSFEDGFMKLNHDFFINKDNKFYGLKQSCLDDYRNGDKDEFELANKGIESKATLAIDILYLSKTENGKHYQGWSIPKYIKEGLSWLRKD